MKHSDYTKMGWHAIFSGQTLTNIYNSGETNIKRILLHYGQYLPKITRIDLAIDIFDSKVKPKHFADLYNNGECTNKRASATYIASLKDEGDTFYIGSLKKRKKLLRIYDKGAEQKSDNDWLRIELQLSNGVSDVPSRLFIRDDADEFELCSGLINNYASFPSDPLWNAVFSGDIPIEKDASDGVDRREEWLLKGVAPSLGEVIASNPKFLQEFMERTLFFRDKARNEWGDIDTDM